jgi:hypothetical protein
MYRSNGVAVPHPPPVVGGELELHYLTPRERWLLMKIRELSPAGRPATIVLMVDCDGLVSVSAATPKGQR